MEVETKVQKKNGIFRATAYGGPDQLVEWQNKLEKEATNIVAWVVQGEGRTELHAVGLCK